MSCRDWYGRDGECVLSRDEICDKTHYLSVDMFELAFVCDVWLIFFVSSFFVLAFLYLF